MYKKHPKSIIIYLVVPLFLILTACGGNEQTAEELMRYHNDVWTDLAEKRDKILSGKTTQLIYMEKTEGNQGGLDFLEEEILTEFKDFIEEEKTIEIHDEAVKELHELLIEADESFYNLLKEKGTAYYLGEVDENELLEVTEKIKKSYQKFFDYRDKLMGQNKLVIDHVRNDKGSYELRMIYKSEAKNLDGIKWGEE